MRRCERKKAIEDLVRLCRPGRTLELDSLDQLGRGTDERVTTARRVFKLGASIRVGDILVTADQADILILGMQSRRRKLDPKEAAKRGGHNRISDEVRAEALKYWKDHNLTVAQLEKLTGRNYSTLWQWFARTHPRPDRRGRPRNAERASR